MRDHDPAGGHFSAIDPQLLAGMIGGLEQGLRALRRQVPSLRSEFERFGVDARSFAEIAGIAGWIEHVLPGLKRRQGLAQAMDGSRAPGFVTTFEYIALSSAQAQDAGRALAGRLNDLDETSRASAEEIHRIALELEQYKNDPDFISAFYVALDRRNRLLTLPDFIAGCGSKTGREDWKVFSEAFGTAVSAQYPAPHFDAIRRSFTEPARNRPAEWSRGAYLAYGRFPADWVASTARANALDEFANEPEQDWRGGISMARWLDLPEDNIALYLEALGRNGEAARDAITYMGYPDHGHSRRENIESLLDYSRLNDPVADAFGRTLAAGSGVGDETMGDHSVAASAFAFDAIVTVGNHKGGVEWVMKDSMGEIAASYAPEMLTGSRMDDGLSRESEIYAPANFEGIPGVDPEFYLSPTDTYRFLKTFAEEDWMSRPFDQAMGELQQKILREAAHADAAAIKRGEQDPENFEKAVGAFGSLAGFAYEAQLGVRGNMDEFDAKMRGLMKDLVTVGVIDRVPGGQYLGEFAWKSIKFAAGKGLGVWVEGGKTRVDGLKDEDLRLIQATRYSMAIALIDAGWTLDSQPRTPFAERGRLLPFFELAKDQTKLDAFNDWLDENNRTRVSFDDKGDDANIAFKGGLKSAEEVSAVVDGNKK
jgi:hypothetical protein